MADRSSLLLIIGFAFSVFSLLFLVIGFATPHWLELDTRYITNSGFEKIGLWEACFKHFAYYKDYTGKTYNGCWWIFSYEYRPIWSYINPPWFLGIQVMMTLTLLTEIAVVLLSLLFLIRCFPGRDSTVALFALGISALTAGILTAISTVIFGTKSVVDRQWIENPDKNFLSWSFGMVVFSGFIIMFAGMCIIVSGLQVRLANQYEKRRKPYADYAPQHQRPQYYS